MMSTEASHYDVVIIGGGPSGSTTGSILRKYDPKLRVLILEREAFPRDHIGESLLPLCSFVIDEMGAWDKVEAADFPVKIGATYKWGKDNELWDFNFLPNGNFKNEARPALFNGQRLRTAFQVDRSKYDQILLDHAESYGCEVRQNTQVVEILHDGDEITGVRLEKGEVITADHYCDCSGNSGIIRRAMGITDHSPTALRNIAIWEYWQDAEWAVKIGVGGTRIQVTSLGYGWVWFIPLGPTRTSVGLVVPAVYYKQSGKRPEELYHEALKSEPRLQKLLASATSEGKLYTTRDWSWVADRACGENWFLVGEAAGFADPILSAGVTMAHMAGRETAYAIMALRKGHMEADWVKSEFSRRQLLRVRQHIRFADFWYAGNGCFTDLKEFVGDIAADAGLSMSPEDAWQWLGQGGFVDEDTVTGTSFFSLRAIEALGDLIGDIKTESVLNKYNVFDLDLEGAEVFDRAAYEHGQMFKRRAYRRDGKVLPLDGAYKLVIEALKKHREIPKIGAALTQVYQARGRDPEFMAIAPHVFPALEAMVNDGWVKGSFDSTIQTERFPDAAPGFFVKNVDQQLV